MKENFSTKELRKLTSGVDNFPPQVLEWISKENLWNLWVPKAYGGLEMPFIEGLKKLKRLANVDGSLGWTITLCSGANYFIGNLPGEVAQQIFIQPRVPVCFGGSGGVCGTAEKQANHYIISGKWPYATGAPYLTHFTLNARITEKGKTLKNKDGTPLVQSFLIPQQNIRVIEDWNAMGLKASATHSFEVKEVVVNEKCSFNYNQFYLPHPIFKIDFSVFAALTLWVNYIGIAEHLLEEAKAILTKNKFSSLELAIGTSNGKMEGFAEATENIINEESKFTEAFVQELYEEAGESVRSLTQGIIRVYPFLGINASRYESQLNQIFRDYFTATQHHIFMKGK